MSFQRKNANVKFEKKKTEHKNHYYLIHLEFD